MEILFERFWIIHNAEDKRKTAEILTGAGRFAPTEQHEPNSVLRYMLPLSV